MQDPQSEERPFTQATRGPKLWHALLLIGIGLLFSIGLAIAGYKAGAFRRWMRSAPKPVSRNVVVQPIKPPYDLA